MTFLDQEILNGKYVKTMTSEVVLWGWGSFDFVSTGCAATILKN